MKLRSATTPIQLLDSSALDLRSAFEAALHELNSAPEAGDGDLEAEIADALAAGLLVMEAQWEYFFPIGSNGAATEWPLMLDSLASGASWLEERARAIRPVASAMASRLNGLALACVDLMPLVLAGWLSQELGRTTPPLRGESPRPAGRRVAEAA